MKVCRRVVAAFAAVAALACTTGCSGGADDSAASTTAVSAPAVPTTAALASPEKGARLTTKQALVLSRMLLLNREAGGADVSVTAPAGTMAAFDMKGAVDWMHHQGAVTVHASGGAAGRPDEALFWSDANLLINVPGLEEAMAAKGKPGVRYASRPLQAGTSTIDQVIVIVASLASDRAENPILLRQADTGYLGSARIDGVAHERYRYGSTIYWVNADGRIARVEATLRTTASPVVIDLRNHGVRQVAVPPVGAVVAAAENADVLAALAARPTG